jgi:PAS domain-containing protein
MVATRIYGVIALMLVTITVMALASAHFAGRATRAGERLFEQGFGEVQQVSRLILAFEKHRRIVGSSPSEYSRDKLKVALSRLRALDREVLDIVATVQANSPQGRTAELASRIAGQWPELSQAAERVVGHASNFAQDKAIDVLEGPYTTVAESIDVEIRAWQEHRSRIADREIRDLYASNSSLRWWVSLSGLVAVLLIGPAGVLIARRHLSRLAKVTGALREVARRNTAIEVPSCADKDEIGSIARAVQVCKRSAIDLIEREHELEKSNSRFDSALSNMSQGLCMFDGEQRLLVCNRRFADLYGIPGE